MNTPLSMNEIVTLLYIKDGYGHGNESVILKSRIVWGCVKYVGTSIKLTAASAGIKADLFVHLWRKEFEENPYTHIELDGKRYKITATGASVNDEYVKLTVSKS